MATSFGEKESVHTSISLIYQVNEWAIEWGSFWEEFVHQLYEYELSTYEIVYFSLMLAVHISAQCSNKSSGSSLCATERPSGTYIPSW